MKKRGIKSYADREALMRFAQGDQSCSFEFGNAFIKDFRNICDAWLSGRSSC